MVRTPSYRLHKPPGKAVCKLGGRDHYLGVCGSSESKKLYRRLLSDYFAVDGDIKKTGNQSDSVSQLIAAFLRFAKNTTARTTHNSATLDGWETELGNSMGRRYPLSLDRTWNGK